MRDAGGTASGSKLGAQQRLTCAVPTPPDPRGGREAAHHHVLRILRCCRGGFESRLRSAPPRRRPPPPIAPTCRALQPSQQLCHRALLGSGRGAEALPVEEEQKGAQVGQQRLQVCGGSGVAAPKPGKIPPLPAPCAARLGCGLGAPGGGRAAHGGCMEAAPCIARNAEQLQLGARRGAGGLGGPAAAAGPGSIVVPASLHQRIPIAPHGACNLCTNASPLHPHGACIPAPMHPHCTPLHPMVPACLHPLHSHAVCIPAPNAPPLHPTEQQPCTPAPPLHPHTAHSASLQPPCAAPRGRSTAPKRAADPPSCPPPAPLLPPPSSSSSSRAQRCRSCMDGRRWQRGAARAGRGNIWQSSRAEQCGAAPKHLDCPGNGGREGARKGGGGTNEVPEQPGLLLGGPWGGRRPLPSALLPPPRSSPLPEPNSSRRTAALPPLASPRPVPDPPPTPSAPPSSRLRAPRQRGACGAAPMVTPRQAPAFGGGAQRMESSRGTGRKTAPNRGIGDGAGSSEESAGREGVRSCGAPRGAAG